MRSRVDPEDLLFVSLVELRDSGTKAKKFVVEANLDLPAELREELGEVGFEIRGPRDKKRIEYSGTTGCSYDGALGFVMMD